jgi:hypothetical protein
MISRKGVTWEELRELIPNLTNEDVQVFTDIFGFLLVSHTTEDSRGSVSGNTFLFFKHANFKRAANETI